MNEKRKYQATLTPQMTHTWVTTEFQQRVWSSVSYVSWDTGLRLCGWKDIHGHMNPSWVIYMKEREPGYHSCTLSMQLQQVTIHVPRGSREGWMDWPKPDPVSWRRALTRVRACRLKFNRLKIWTRDRTRIVAHFASRVSVYTPPSDYTIHTISASREQLRNGIILTIEKHNWTKWIPWW